MASIPKISTISSKMDNSNSSFIHPGIFSEDRLKENLLSEESKISVDELKLRHNFSLGRNEKTMLLQSEVFLGTSPLTKDIYRSYVHQDESAFSDEKKFALRTNSCETLKMNDSKRQGKPQVAKFQT